MLGNLHCVHWGEGKKLGMTLEEGGNTHRLSVAEGFAGLKETLQEGGGGKISPWE